LIENPIENSNRMSMIPMQKDFQNDEECKKDGHILVAFHLFSSVSVLAIKRIKVHPTPTVTNGREQSRNQKLIFIQETGSWMMICAHFFMQGIYPLSSLIL
jgi:hypothetical protein